MLQNLLASFALVAVVCGQGCYHVVEIPASGNISITSPNYPSAYNANTNCRWVIAAAPGEDLEFTATFFDTEPLADFLFIGDAAFHGQSGPVWFLVNSSRAVVRFTSDSSSQRQGFSVNVRSIPSKLLSSIAVEVTCAVGHLSFSDTDPESSAATDLHFNTDNTWKCRLLLWDLHSWLLAATATSRNNPSPLSATCNKGNVTFSHLDPDLAESSSFVFNGDNSLKCRRELFGLHEWLLVKAGIM